MWSLIVIILVNLFSIEENICILIVDDCSNWKKHNHSLGMKGENMFSYEKDDANLLFVSLTRTWLKGEVKPDSKLLTLSEIIENKPFYTSEISSKDWRQFIDDQKGKKILILTPEEYCSQNRFTYDYEFTLYEMRVYIPNTE